jgi:RNA polymerase sigma-70 factor (ECF subfamily)
MRDSSDQQLMTRIGQGDQKAFQEVYRRYSASVYGYGMKLMKERAAAEDIVQEVWIKTVRMAAAYRGDGSLKGWLLKITRNTALNVFRSRRIEIEFEETSAADIAPADFENQVLSAFEIAKLKEHIAALPDAQRVALVLWITEHLDYEKIASEMGTSVAAVKSLIFRARRQLETLMGGAA